MDSIVQQGARQGLENMLGFKPGEKITIVTDKATMAETENAFVEVAKEITGETNVTVYVLEDYGQRPLAEVPKGLAESARNSNVTMFVAQSLGDELETVRRPLIKTAVGAGAAHGHCPGFTRNMMMEGMAADYNVVYALSRALHDILSDVKRISVSNDAGTNLVVDTLKHFPWVYSQPITRGSWANLPDGEIFCAPYNVNGTAVLDGCVGDFLGEKYGNIGKSPIYVNIHAGMAVEIKCPEDKDLENDFKTYVMNLDGKREFLTRKVGEFALGTNLGIENITGNLLQDEKLGFASHIAFGDPLADDDSNAGYSCKGHIDGLMIRPTVKADGKTIMDKGQYAESVMRETLKYLPTGYSLSKDKLSFVAPSAVA